MPVEQINRTTLFHEQTGRGEPLVLVHGAWVDHTSWDAVVAGLAESFRVVTYDLRGHGASSLEPRDAGTVQDDIADLVALVDHLGLGAVNVAGISSGACIALRLAIEHPAIVRRVLPHEPPSAQYLAGDPDNKPLLDDIGELLAATHDRIVAGDHRAAAQRFFDELVMPWADIPAATQDRIISHAVAFLGQLRDPDAVTLESRQLGELTMPVLLSQGAWSHRFATLVVEQLALILPNARRHVVSGAGHVPQMTHPEDYVAMVTEFVQST